MAAVRMRPLEAPNCSTQSPAKEPASAAHASHAAALALLFRPDGRNRPIARIGLFADM